MRLTITRPDDWHLHVRDGDVLPDVLKHSARRFARAIIMPNLNPPIVHVSDASAYRDRIRAALPEGAQFEPLMTLYLTDATSPNEIERAGDAEFVHAVKLYPAGATTHSASGVTRLAHVYNVLEKMQRLGIPLLIHGEVTAREVDVFDREKVFIEQTLARLVKEFPALRIVLEHITTREAVQFITEAREGVAATITCHHLLYNRGAMFAGGFTCDPLKPGELVEVLALPEVTVARAALAEDRPIPAPSDPAEAFAPLLQKCEYDLQGMEDTFRKYDAPFRAEMMGNRLCYHFIPEQCFDPLTGLTQIGFGGLFEFSHHYLWYHGLLIMPFFNMFLICPQHTAEDLDTFLRVFDDMIAIIMGQKKG